LEEWKGYYSISKFKLRHSCSSLNLSSLKRKGTKKEKEAWIYILKSMETANEVRNTFLRPCAEKWLKYPLLCQCIGYGKIHQGFSEQIEAKSSHP
jgi:hypothetical protein